MEDNERAAERAICAARLCARRGYGRSRKRNNDRAEINRSGQSGSAAMRPLLRQLEPPEIMEGGGGLEVWTGAKGGGSAAFPSDVAKFSEQIAAKPRHKESPRAGETEGERTESVPLRFVFISSWIIELIGQFVTSPGNDEPRRVIIEGTRACTLSLLLLFLLLIRARAR